MRRPRDFDSELKVLGDKAKMLRERKVRQLGELVIACGADALPLEQLAGVLLDSGTTKDASRKEGWRVAGAAFFQHARRTTAGSDGSDSAGAATSPDGTQSRAALPGT